MNEKEKIFLKTWRKFKISKISKRAAEVVCRKRVKTNLT